MTAPATAPSVPTPGFETVAWFSSVEEEYEALRQGAVLVDRSARQRMLFAGARAAETLTGLVTNDVLALRPGSGQYAAALTAKGKIIADVRLFARADDLLVDTSAAAAPGWSAMIRKYVNPRLAQYADVSAVLRTVGVFGPRAAETIARALNAEANALTLLPPYHHLALEWHGARLHVARVPDAGGDGFDLFVPMEAASGLWSTLANAGAVRAGQDVFTIARVEAGRPLWGADMTEDTLAQEANFDALGGISYTKGCYTGQETVARVHFRGHVNRMLRGITADAPIPAGAPLFSAEGNPCGDVRTSVVSPKLGAIAIVMLRHEIPTDSPVIARADAQEHMARVRELPFA